RARLVRVFAVAAAGTADHQRSVPARRDEAGGGEGRDLRHAERRGETEDRRLSLFFTADETEARPDAGALAARVVTHLHILARQDVRARERDPIEDALVEHHARAVLARARRVGP